MCITPPLCIRGGKLWFLIPVEKTGAWLHKMLVFLVLVFFFPILVMFLISWTTIYWSFALSLQKDSSSSHSLFPCPSFVPISNGCHTFPLSLCTNLAAERKRTTGIFLFLLILITFSLFEKHFSLCCLHFELVSEAGWARVCFIWIWDGG